MTITKLDAQKYGPWAVIAGGSDGTGAAFARIVAQSGINLLLVARRPEPLEQLAAELRQQYGVEVRTLSLDLNRPDAAQQMADAMKGKEVGLYISNAGAGDDGPTFLETSPETIQGIIARNITTVIEACRLFAPAMVERGRGGILLMGSGTGLGGQTGFATYAGAKGFVQNFAESLWAELRHKGVNVIGIAAPTMDTPRLRATVGDLKLPGVYPPEDVAEMAVKWMQAGEPCYVYPLTPSADEGVQLSHARRDRILRIESMVAALFDR